MSSTTADWLLECSGLTVGPEDPTALGHDLASSVRAAAAAYLAVSPCADAPVGECASRCTLATTDGGAAACRLARRLAPTAARLPSAQPSGVPGVDMVTRRYLNALRRAAGAVFHCRHAHAAGECWFSAAPGERLCGEVLAAAHRLGA